jgi:large subunit ribosomal protein L1
MPRSKRYSGLKAQLAPKKLYTPAEAIELAKASKTTKFDETIEVHANLGIDVKKSDQAIRSTLVFPHTAGKAKKIAAFVPEAKETEAKEAGADIVGREELIDEIAKSGKIDFDVAVATPDMMPKMAKVAKILGPKGLMPNPKTETVGPNIKKLIEELKRGKIAFKNDATGNVHVAIGKASLDSAKLLENLTVFMEALKKNKPSTSKGTFIKSVTVASTMGPGIRIDTSSI